MPVIGYGGGRRQSAARSGGPRWLAPESPVAVGHDTIRPAPGYRRKHSICTHKCAQAQDMIASRAGTAVCRDLDPALPGNIIGAQ